MARSKKPSGTKGVHIFINAEGGITIGQTLADDSEIHVSLTPEEAALLLRKLPALLAEWQEGAIPRR